MKKFYSILLLLISILTVAQTEVKVPDFIKEIQKEVPNLKVADSLYNRYREQKEGKPFGYYTEYFKEKGFLDAWHSEFHHWRKDHQIFANANGDIIIPVLTNEEFNRKQYRIEHKNKIEQEYLEHLNKVEQKGGKQTTQTQKAPVSTEWTYLGPKTTYSTSKVKVDIQANAFSVDQAHNNRDILFCSIEGSGIFKSTDRGETWDEVTMDIKLLGTIEKLKIHPENDDIIVGINEYQIVSSINGGVDWRQVSIPTNLPTPSSYSLYNLADLDIVYDETTTGFDDDYAITVGRRGNYKFNIIENTIEIFSTHNLPSSDVKVHPNNSSVIYILSFDDVTNTEKIYKSTDRAVSFQVKDANGWLTPPAGQSEITMSRGGRIGLTPADDDVIYVHMIGEYSSSGDNGFIGIYKSTDGGDNWQLMDALGPGSFGAPYVTGNSNLSFTNYVAHPNIVSNVNGAYHQGFYNSGIVVDPVNPDHIIVGGVGIFKSIDGGSTFKMLSNGYIFFNGPNDRLHPDFQSCFSRINELGETETWLSTDGGVVMSKDFFEDIVGSAKKTVGLPCDFWGFDVGIFKKNITGGRYHNGSIGSLVEYNGDFLYVGGAESATGGIMIGNEERDMIWDDTNNRTLNTDIFANHPTFGGISIFPDGHTGNSIAGMAKTLTGSYYYVNKSNKTQLYKTYLDSSGSYRQLLINTFSSTIRYVGTCATNENYIYATTLDGNNRARLLYRTEDGGLTWSNVFDFATVGLGGNVHLEVDNNDPNKIWAYQFGGGKLFFSDNGGNTFTEMAAIPSDKINHLVYQWSSNNIYAMVRGSNQIYRYDIANDSWHEFGSGLPESIDAFRLGITYGEKKLLLSASGHGIWEIDLFSDSDEDPIYAFMLSDIIIGYDKSDMFELRTGVYGDTSSKTISWETNAPSATINTIDAYNSEVTFNNYGIYDVIYKITDNNTGNVHEVVKKFYIYPGCSFDDDENNILIPMDNVGLWLTGDDIYLSHKVNGDSGQVYNKYGIENNFGNPCLPLTFPKYNNTEHRAINFNGVNHCRLMFEKIHTEGKTFFWVLNEDESSGTTIRPLLGDSRSASSGGTTDFHAGYPSNRYLLESDSFFDLTKMNGAVIDARATDRPTTPSVITFRVNSSSSVTFDNFARDRNFGDRVWKGNLAELIVYDRRLTEAEVQKVEQYLMKKYKITP